MPGGGGLRKHGHTSAGDGGTITVPGGDAEDVTYDPTASGLTATDLQAAIDELDTTIDGLGGAGVDIADDAALIQGVNFEDLGSDPSAPAAGHHVIYAKAGGVYIEDDASAVVGPLGTGSVPQALDTTDSPQFVGVNVGHATDTTLARVSSGVLSVEGNRIFAVGGADVPIADGGTGASTATAAFDALSPMTTAGDIIIGGASGTRTRLAAGTATHVLTSNGAGVAPSYQAVAGTGTVTTVKDEGSNLSTAVTSIDFVGAGVTATGTTAVTVTIPGGSGGTTFKSTTRAGAGNYTTTSTTRTPIDGTNLAYLTFTLAIGDVVRCTLRGLGKTSSDGFPASFDFEVDQPTSANVYIATGHDYGVPSPIWTSTRTAVVAEGLFTATEAGAHGFRPVWYVESTATATLSNASSGGDDVPIYFVVENLGQPAA